MMNELTLVVTMIRNVLPLLIDMYMGNRDNLSREELLEGIKDDVSIAEDRLQDRIDKLNERCD